MIMNAHSRSHSKDRPTSALESRTCRERSRSNHSQSQQVQPRYMNATTASTMRQKKGLTLREKIFELHDAVRTLQSNNAASQRQVSKERQPERTDTTSQFTAMNAKVEAVEGQCGILRQAIGTMADAVSEEIDEVRRELS